MNDGREFWIGRIDPDRVYELFGVMVHYLPRSVVSCGREASHLHQTSTRANVPIAWEYRTWVANRWPCDCATPLKSMRAESSSPRYVSGARPSEQAVLLVCRASVG